MPTDDTREVAHQRPPATNNDPNQTTEGDAEAAAHGIATRTDHDESPGNPDTRREEPATREDVATDHATAPSTREIAALTARLRKLSAAGAHADPAERASFLDDKNALLDRIAATDTATGIERHAPGPSALPQVIGDSPTHGTGEEPPQHDFDDDWDDYYYWTHDDGSDDDGRRALHELHEPIAEADLAWRWAPSDLSEWLADLADNPKVSDTDYRDAQAAVNSATLGDDQDDDHHDRITDAEAESLDRCEWDEALCWADAHVDDEITAVGAASPGAEGGQFDRHIARTQQALHELGQQDDQAPGTGRHDSADQRPGRADADGAAAAT